MARGRRAGIEPTASIMLRRFAGVRAGRLFRANHNDY